MSTDTLKWQPMARVRKYYPDQVQAIIKRIGHEPNGLDLAYLEREGLHAPDEIVESPGNLLTTAGLNRITNLIIGGGGQAFTTSRGVVGVGSSSTPETTSDGALGGNGSSTTAWYQSPDASNPTQANGVITCNATFGTSNANFAWNEWCWGIATAAVTAGATFATVSTSGILLNHKVQSLGTKTSGSVWTHQATITLS